MSIFNGFESLKDETSGTGISPVNLNEWDENIKNLLSKSGNDMEHLEQIMLLYKSLLPKYKRKTDKMLLSKKILRHINFFFFFYLEVKYEGRVAVYYDLMEDILAYYCTLEFEILKKKSVVYSVSQKLIYVISTFLENRDVQIHHVLLKMKYNTKSPIIRNVLNLIFRHFLMNTPILEENDEAYCRYYILFLKYKGFLEDKDHADLDNRLSKNFVKYNENYINENYFLKKVLVREFDDYSDFLWASMNIEEEMIKKYFESFNELKMNITSFDNERLGLLSNNRDGNENILGPVNQNSLKCKSEPECVIEIHDEEGDDSCHVNYTEYTFRSEDKRKCRKKSKPPKQLLSSVVISLDSDDDEADEKVNSLQSTDKMNGIDKSVENLNKLLSKTTVRNSCSINKAKAPIITTIEIASDNDDDSMENVSKGNNSIETETPALKITEFIDDKQKKISLMKDSPSNFKEMKSIKDFYDNNRNHNEVNNLSKVVKIKDKSETSLFNQPKSTVSEANEKRDVVCLETKINESIILENEVCTKTNINAVMEIQESTLCLKSNVGEIMDTQEGVTNISEPIKIQENIVSSKTNLGELMEIQEDVCQKTYFHESVKIPEDICSKPNLSEPMEIREEIVSSNTNISEGKVIQKEKLYSKLNLSKVKETKERLFCPKTNFNQSEKIAEGTVGSKPNISEVVEIQKDVYLKTNLNKTVKIPEDVCSKPNLSEVMEIKKGLVCAKTNFNESRKRSEGTVCSKPDISQIIEIQNDVYPNKFLNETVRKPESEVCSKPNICELKKVEEEALYVKINNSELVQIQESIVSSQTNVSEVIEKQEGSPCLKPKVIEITEREKLTNIEDTMLKKGEVCLNDNTLVDQVIENNVDAELEEQEVVCLTVKGNFCPQIIKVESLFNFETENSDLPIDNNDSLLEKDDAKLNSLNVHIPPFPSVEYVNNSKGHESNTVNNDEIVSSVSQSTVLNLRNVAEKRLSNIPLNGLSPTKLIDIIIDTCTEAKLLPVGRKDSENLCSLEKTGLQSQAMVDETINEDNTTGGYKKNSFPDTPPHSDDLYNPPLPHTPYQVDDFQGIIGSLHNESIHIPDKPRRDPETVKEAYEKLIRDLVDGEIVNDRDEFSESISEVKINNFENVKETSSIQIISAVTITEEDMIKNSLGNNEEVQPMKIVHSTKNNLLSQKYDDLNQPRLDATINNEDLGEDFNQCLNGPLIRLDTLNKPSIFNGINTNAMPRRSCFKQSTSRRKKEESQSSRTSSPFSSTSVEDISSYKHHIDKAKTVHFNKKPKNDQNGLLDVDKPYQKLKRKCEQLKMTSPMSRTKVRVLNDSTVLHKNPKDTNKRKIFNNKGISKINFNGVDPNEPQIFHLKPVVKMSHKSCILDRIYSNRDLLVETTTDETLTLKPKPSDVPAVSDWDQRLVTGKVDYSKLLTEDTKIFESDTESEDELKGSCSFHISNTPEKALNLVIPPKNREPCDFHLEFSNSPTFFNDLHQVEECLVEKNEEPTDHSINNLMKTNISFLSNNSNFFKNVPPLLKSSKNDPVNINIITKPNSPKMPIIYSTDSNSSIKNVDLCKKDSNAEPIVLKELNEFHHTDSAEHESEKVTCLPFKKRRVSVSVKQDAVQIPKTEEISYPARPMYNIAHIEALQSQRPFKTLAERKEMPTIFPKVTPITTIQYNPPTNYNNFVTMPYLTCNSYYQIPSNSIPIYNNLPVYEARNDTPRPVATFQPTTKAGRKEARRKENSNENYFQRQKDFIQ